MAIQKEHRKVQYHIRTVLLTTEDDWPGELRSEQNSEVVQWTLCVKHRRVQNEWSVPKNPFWSLHILRQSDGTVHHLHALELQGQTSFPQKVSPHQTVSRLLPPNI